MYMFMYDMWTGINGSFKSDMQIYTVYDFFYCYITK